MKQSIFCNQMKGLISALLFLLPLNNSYGQVTKYERLNCIAHRAFNFVPNARKFPTVRKK